MTSKPPFPEPASFTTKDVMLSWCKGYVLALEDLIDDTRDWDTGMSDFAEHMERTLLEARRTMASVQEHA